MRVTQKSAQAILWGYEFKSPGGFNDQVQKVQHGAA